MREGEEEGGMRRGGEGGSWGQDRERTRDRKGMAEAGLYIF